MDPFRLLRAAAIYTVPVRESVGYCAVFACTVEDLRSHVTPPFTMTLIRISNMEENPKIDEEEAGGGELRIEYVESDDYDILPSSTVRGGVQLGGDYLFEFYTERYEDPEAAVYNITPDGGIGEQVRTEAYDGNIVREKQIGIMMSQVNAFNLATWTIANLLGDGVTDSDVEEALDRAFGDQIGEANQEE